MNNDEMNKRYVKYPHLVPVLKVTDILSVK